MNFELNLVVYVDVLESMLQIFMKKSNLKVDKDLYDLAILIVMMSIQNVDFC